MKYFYFYIYIFLQAAVFLIFTSCTFWENHVPEESLEIQLPQWPPADLQKENYPPLSRWLIKIESTGLRNESQSFSFFTNEKSFTLNIEKNVPAAITARPVTISGGKESTFFKAAGMIYPERKIYLTWEGGFLAEIMQRLMQSRRETGLTDAHIKDFLASFNWKKAQDMIDAKITKALAEESGTFYNPWLTDASEIPAKISFGHFKTEDLNNKNCMTLNTDFFEEKILSSFVLENNFIAEKNKVLIKKDVLNLFYSPQDYGIILEGSSEKNLSVRPCNLPIYLEETTPYEKTSGIYNSGNINDYSSVLQRQSAPESK